MTTRRGWLIITASSLFLFLCFPAVCYGVAQPRTLLNKLSEGKTLTNQELWFKNQTLDHFSPYVLPFSLSLLNWKILTISFTELFSHNIAVRVVRLAKLNKLNFGLQLENANKL